MANKNTKKIPNQSGSVKVALGRPGIVSKELNPCEKRTFCQMPYKTTIIDELKKNGMTFLRSSEFWIKTLVKK